MSLIISLFRLIAGPVALWLIMSESPDMLWGALVLMLASVALGLMNSAMLSGTSTDLEKVIHIVSDSIYHISVFIAFFVNEWISIWMVLLIYSREIMIPYTQSFALQSGVRIADDLISSRLKAMVHGLCQITILAVILGKVPETVANMNSISLLVSLAAGMSVISFILYLTAVSNRKASHGTA